MSSRALGVHSLCNGRVLDCFYKGILLLYFVYFWESELFLLKKEDQLPQGLFISQRQLAYEEKRVKCFLFIIF